MEILTIEEYKEKYFPYFHWDEESAEQLAIGFAKYHSELALKAASKIKTHGLFQVHIFNSSQQEEILNAYPLTNIK